MYIPTQGLVFSGSRSEYYPSNPCYGVVITARCDIAQAKVKNIHYLTALPLNDWMKKDCFFILMEELNKASNKALKKWFSEQEDLYPNVVDEVGVSELRKIISFHQKGQKSNKQLENSLDEWELSLEGLRGKLDEEGVLSVLNGKLSGKKKSKMDLLIRHQLTGYYYLNTPNNIGGQDGLVVNLRDIRSMNLDMMYHMLSGQYDCLKNRALMKDDELNKVFYLQDENDFAYPEDVIHSPIIEHLMQNFSLVFSRIGLDDVPEHEVDRIKNYVVTR